jgi:benzoate/toluate 1,2-dioxygenase beta subunit
MMAQASEDMTAAPNIDIELQLAVERFLYEQSEILDDRRWDDWLALFTEDGLYWMPAHEEQTTGEGVPNIFYEDRFLMDMRIKRVTHPRAHSQQPPNKTSHVVSNVVIEADDAASGEITVRSRFYAAEYRNDITRHFAGRYRHTLVRAGTGFQIKLQRVDLVNGEAPFDYVLQYWL